MGNWEIKEAPVTNPPATDTDKLKAQHDALYGKYSQSRADLVKLAKVAFEANPSVLDELEEEIKDKITKDKFWFETFNEALAVLWDGFYKKEQNSNDKTDLEKTVAELSQAQKIAEYKNKNKEEETAMEIFLAKNEDISSIEDAKEKLKKEIKKLSDALPFSERLDTAALLVKTTYWKKINFANTTSGKNVKVDEKWVARNPNLARIFGNKI